MPIGRFSKSSTSSIDPFRRARRQQTTTVASTSPAPGATQVPSDQVVTVRLSSPVAGTSGMPMFNPPVNGAWTKSGAQSLVFTLNYQTVT